jgi:large subunit ribosomal protein L29
MAIMRIKQIVSMSSEDRVAKLVDLRAELARIRTMINAGGAVENPTRVRELRKTIAQILTVENEKKLGIRQVVVEAEEKPKKKTEKTPEKAPAAKKAATKKIEAKKTEATVAQ